MPHLCPRQPGTDAVVPAPPPPPSWAELDTPSWFAHGHYLTSGLEEGRNFFITLKAWERLDEALG